MPNTYSDTALYWVAAIDEDGKGISKEEKEEGAGKIR